MCQCAEPITASYPAYDTATVMYPPVEPIETVPYPYPYSAYEPPPPPFGIPLIPIVPVPTGVVYDPYWPSRVTPSHRPLLLVSPMKRFRGEIRSGNCLMVVE